MSVIAKHFIEVNCSTLKHKPRTDIHERKVECFAGFATREGGSGLFVDPFCEASQAIVVTGKKEVQAIWVFGNNNWLVGNVVIGLKKQRRFLDQRCLLLLIGWGDRRFRESLRFLRDLDQARIVVRRIRESRRQRREPEHFYVDHREEQERQWEEEACVGEW